MTSNKKNQGFSLVETVVVLGIIAMLGATITPLIIQTLDNKRERDTIEELREFRKAIVGDSRIITKEVRTYFGYIGDMGSLPSTIEDLYVKGTQPAFTFNTDKKTGAGWNGPYIDPSLVENFNSLKKDVQGNDYEYSATAFTDVTTGVPVVGKVLSKGLDGTSGGGDDLTIYIFKPEVFSKVVGFVKDGSGNRTPNVIVKMNYPSSGILAQTSTTTDNSGFYSFDDIPYGSRSVTVEPKIIYSAGSAVTRAGPGHNVEFKVTNFSASAIALTFIKLDYTVTPAAFYSQLIIGGTTVFNSTIPRKGSGDIIPISPAITITGTGASLEGKSFPVRIQSPVTQVADLNLGEASKGGTLRIQVNDFEDVSSGTGAPVNMTGVSFEVTFSDGSKVLFAPTTKG